MNFAISTGTCTYMYMYMYVPVYPCFEFKCCPLDWWYQKTAGGLLSTWRGEQQVYHAERILHADVNTPKPSTTTCTQFIAGLYSLVFHTVYTDLQYMYMYMYHSHDAVQISYTYTHVQYIYMYVSVTIRLPSSGQMTNTPML